MELTISDEQQVVNGAQTTVCCTENQNRCPSDAHGAHVWVWATVEKDISGGHLVRVPFTEGCARCGQPRYFGWFRR